MSRHVIPLSHLFGLLLSFTSPAPSNSPNPSPIAAMAAAPTIVAHSLRLPPLRHQILPHSSRVILVNVGINAASRLAPSVCPFLSRRRRNLVFAVNQDAEKSFQKTVEVDRLIDMLRESNSRELEKLVVENIFAFNEDFWIRLAARSDSCKSDDDKKDYEELAASVMSIVDCVVHKTHERIDSATDILKAILKPVVDDVEEISWPPRDPENLILMEKELTRREQEGQLDEGFLSEVNSQLRQAKEDGDKPGLVAMLQKVLQIYASKVLSKRSYAYKGGEVLKAEKFLESILEAPEEKWNKLILNGLTIGNGEVSPEEFYAVIKKRNERILIRTEGGSYQQRILTEYLNGVESRTKEIVQAIQGPQQ